MRLGLARIPKGRIAIGKGDLPKVCPEFVVWISFLSIPKLYALQAVHILIEEEFLRSCAIAYTAQPRIARRDGWGTPGSFTPIFVIRTSYRLRTFALQEQNTRMCAFAQQFSTPSQASVRTCLLFALFHFRLIIFTVDKAARKVIPSMPSLSPHVPLSRHLRHIMPLVSADALGEMHFRAYTDAVEKARYAEQELTEEQFGAAVDSGAAISDMCARFMPHTFETICFFANICVRILV